MQIHLIAVGNRLPQWMQSGFQEYARRLPPQCRIKLIEISPGKRSKGADLARIKQIEGEQILQAIPKGAQVIALEVGGVSWNSEQLSRQLGLWLQQGRDVALLVGGPEGLSDACRQRAERQWSISSLTLPHGLVRVVLAEQIYRAWSQLSGHPYHR